MIRYLRRRESVGRKVEGRQIPFIDGEAIAIGEAAGDGDKHQ
ncbi:MAG TPA: hypothetical protein VF605_18935 [Allosphingosinicella sp.]